MKRIIKFLKSLSHQPKATPTVTPQEGMITFEKLANIVKRQGNLGLHIFKSSERAGYNFYAKHNLAGTRNMSLKGFFDQFDEDGSPLSGEKK